ncbi:hypothetical protein BC939DRAFT_450252 [Gamsiella multidivaricata]|uniref:uncharacterized protein n=1 Tax=Gamsiella multidivaricata TaxID=101098 RepID=UPI002220BB26|nr:uncharacterized protein BC939DRAFT_450252 [Gamsiella multidivaricata]KAI7824394.1 hypothetical protein BC939DRAFT_450252 [Gamsiella multidivaricata]
MVTTEKRKKKRKDYYIQRAFTIAYIESKIKRHRLYIMLQNKSTGLYIAKEKQRKAKQSKATQNKGIEKKKN